VSLTVSNTTQNLTSALKDMNRTEGIEVRKKNEELPVKTVAKAVALSISAEAKLEILKDTLK
tara:strand:- start:233 stop:418 length:186 start_codon:yes stop_codon:yes gene_type:complete